MFIKYHFFKTSYTSLFGITGSCKKKCRWCGHIVFYL